MSGIIRSGLVSTLLVLAGTVALLCSTTQLESAEKAVMLKSFTGEEARQYWKEIAELRLGMFREFPYLYEGTFEGEKAYLETYFSSKNSSILLAFDGNKVVGFSNSIPLADEVEEIKAPLLRKRLDVKDYLYIGEVMVAPAYRGEGLLRQYFEHHEKLAIEKGYPYTTFMTVNRSPFHPAKPINYRPLDPIWEHFGYRPLEGAEVLFSWNQTDTGQEEENVLQLWTKEIKPSKKIAYHDKE